MEVKLKMNTRRCKECGKEFVPRTERQQYCDNEHFRPCPVCGKLVVVKYLSDPPRTCSKQCAVIRRQKTCVDKYGCRDAGNRPTANEKRKQTCLERYGVENPSYNPDVIEKIRETKSNHTEEEKAAIRKKMSDAWTNMSEERLHQVNNKRRETCLIKYGVDNPRKCEEIKQKTKATLMKTYGVDCTLKIPEVRNKANNTMLDRYGTVNVNAVKEIQAKARKTCLERYGSPYYQQTDECKEKVIRHSLDTTGYAWPGMDPDTIQKRVQTNLDRYGVPAAFLLPEHQEKLVEGMRNAKHSRISQVNRDFFNKLTENGIKCELEFRIKNYWYDIVIPESHTVIEIDPSISHTTYPVIYGEIDKNYHKSKSEIASLNGYRCIHVFDWDNWDKIISMISPKNKIFARNCTVSVIDESSADQFLAYNHIQGSVKGQIICLGLFDKNDELVEVMTFGCPRYNKKYQWELLRLASSRDYSVLGGAGKLLSHFVKELNPESLISYCNLSKFNGDVYTKLGFKLLRTNSPGKWWSKSSRVISDALLRQRGYDQLFGTHYGKGTSNEELMIKNWWLPVYDCGQAVYTWKKEA